MRVSLGGKLIVSLFAVSLASCVSAEPRTTATVTSGGGPSIQQAQQEAYNGPKARTAVNKFTVKSSKGHHELGQGLADMLTTALFHSNRFIVLDRTDHKDVMAEQDLGASGRIKNETAAPIGQMEGAELLVTAAVTAFEPDAAGGAGGIGVPVGGAGFLGVGGGGKQAYMAIDLKVVDTKTGRIVGAVTVEGRSTDWFAGIGGAIGGVPIPFGLIGYQKTPMEKAIRVCIVKAVDYIASQTPATYFHNR
jgi:curli biogenesis system outer membrane secretion channel CsgG